MNRSILHTAVFVVVMASFACRSADATVIELTSGESTGGWNAASFSFQPIFAGDEYAYFGLPAGQGQFTGGLGQIQGVQFVNNNLGYFGALPGTDTLTGNSAFGAGPIYGNSLYFGSSVNDQGLAWMMGTGYSGNMTLTLNNLGAGAEYHLAYFVNSYTNTNTSETITSTGAQTVSDYVAFNSGAFAPGNSNTFVVEQNVYANSLGTIVTTFSGAGPTFSGFVLSTVVVPEPSAFVLIGVGAVGLLAAARHRRRCFRGDTVRVAKRDVRSKFSAVLNGLGFFRGIPAIQRVTLRTAALVLVMASFACRSADATVIALTSGESTGGWVAPPSAQVLWAGDFSAYYGYPAGQSLYPGALGQIQGVQFQNNNIGYSPVYGSGPYGLLPAGDSLTGYAGGINFYPGPSFGASLNDEGMAAMLSQSYYNFVPGSSMTLTLANLNAGEVYNLAYFVYWPSTAAPANVAETITSTGTGTVSDNVTLNSGSFGSAYVVEQSLTASSGGTIVTVFDGLTNYSTVSGFVLSTTPEPSAFVLIGVGAVGLLAAARHRRRCYNRS